MSIVYQVNRFVGPLAIALSAAFVSWNAFFQWVTLVLALISFLIAWMEKPITGTLWLSDDFVHAELNTTADDLMSHDSAYLRVKKGGQV